MRYAHRVAWEIETGEPIPPGLEIDHVRCDQESCVEFTHLRACTQQENNERSGSESALNARKTECKNGHPFVEGNMYVYTRNDGTTERICKTCRSEDQRRLRAKWKARAKLAAS
jgi:hypothetical protein